MFIKGVIFEDFVNYKKPVMYIAFPCCSFKCDKENGAQYCQNWKVARQPNIEISATDLVERYLSNPITKGVVLSGLEPFDTPQQVLDFVRAFRTLSNDPIIIFTGYKEEELENGYFFRPTNHELNRAYWNKIKSYGVIVKFGRFRPNQEPHYDEVLGVYLASDNQYAKEFNTKI